MDERERYQQYLCGRDWAVLREAVRNRSGGICERCRHFPMDHVHHLTYIRKYHERLEDLQAICLGCHEFTHGKRDRDPRLDVPVKLLGREIGTVYLAGKISGDNWRDEIIPRWSSHPGHGGIEVDAGPWTTCDEPVHLPDGRSIGYVGPYYLDLTGGHGTAGGPHAYGKDVSGHGCDMATDATLVSIRSRQAIQEADLVFAWVDSRECFGTLVEIGFAAGWATLSSPGRRICRIILASPSEDRELWFASSIADAVIGAPTAGQAWRKLWESPPTFRGSGRPIYVRDYEDESEDDPDDDDGIDGSNPDETTVYRCDSRVFRLGMKVLHPQYGLGFIDRFEGSGDATKATIVFQVSGTKYFLLSKSPIRPAEASDSTA